MKVSPKLAAELQRTRPMSCLVVGSTGHGRQVKAYPWDELSQDVNIGDFDIVILNFAAFYDKALAAGLPLDRLPSRKVMARVLFSPNTEIIAIGDPRTVIGDERSTHYRADYWLPYRLGIENDSGTSYTVLAEQWQPYFHGLSRWRWIATGECEPSVYDATEYISPAVRTANSLAIRFEPIALSRTQQAIATEVRIQAWHANHRGQQLLAESCPVFWIPASDKIPVIEGIDVILRERYGVAEETHQPAWVADYALPSVAPIQAEIGELKRKRAAIDRQISEAQIRKADAERPNLLLYENGKDVLEPIVRKVLGELGARVEDPEREGVEDGRLFRDGHAGVVEIKGRRGPIKQDDVRQVVQWAADARGHHGLNFKPIIIGNPYCATPPVDRGDPFAPNAKTYAENSGVVLVTTSQLYEALRRQQEGGFDENGFWETIFATVGLAHISQVQPSMAHDGTSSVELTQSRSP